MLPYWLLWAFFFIGAVLAHRQASLQQAELPSGATDGLAEHARSGLTIMAVAGLIAMTLMVGLRFEVGGDWVNYERIFVRSSFRTFDQIFLQSDPGYAFLNWVTSQVGAGIWLVNLACAIPTVVGVAALARREPQPWLAILIAIPYLIIVVGMGYTRQAAALGFVMIGLASLLDKGSLLRMVLWTAIGALFHKSAIICLPLVAFTGKRSKAIDLALLASAAIGLYTLFVQDSVDRLLRNYIAARYSSSGAAIRVSMSLLPAIVFLLFRRRLGLTDEERQLWRNFSLVAVIAAIALVVTPSSTAVDRIALYLLPLQFVILARIPGTLLARNFGNLLVSAYTAAVLYIWLNYAANADSWLPYRSYFDA